MKKLLKFPMLIASMLIVQCLTAQSVVQVAGLKADDVWNIVYKVLNDNKLTVVNSKIPESVESDFKEYSAGLFKNRAKVLFAYQNDNLTITLKDRQTVSSNTWADALIPSKKADDKLTGSFADKIRSIATNPDEIAKLKSQPAPGSTGVATSGNTSGSRASGQPAAKKPSLANAKEVRFDNGDNYVFTEGLCAVKKNDQWGFIDTVGNVVIGFDYGSWVGFQNPKFSSGAALVAAKDPSGMGRMPIYIDKKGQQLFKNQKFTGATNFESGIAVVEKSSSTMARSFQFINKQGLLVPGSMNFGKVFGSLTKTFAPFHEGLTKFYDSNSSSYGFINTQGKWVVMPKNYAEVGDFSEGMALVQSKDNWNWGFINTKGELKIPFDYKNKPGKFSEGLAAIVDGSKGQVGFIDKDGKTAIPFNYSQVFPIDAEGNKVGSFKNGFAVVYKEESPWGNYVIIDKTGKIIRKIVPEAVKIWNNGWIYWKGSYGGSKVGIISPEGKDLLIPEYFTEIGEFSNGLAYARATIDDKNVSGFINLNFDFVIIQSN
jgi:hypothetical protein